MGYTTNELLLRSTNKLRKMRSTCPLTRLFFALFIVFQANAQDRIITTGVPFLLITPDARAAGMGEVGVATSADAYAQQWNPAKYPFSENNSGLGLSYTPYLRQIVDDIFLGKKSHVWQQALNRVHVQKSILLYCFGKLR